MWKHPPPSTVPATPRTALSRVYCKAGIILAHPRTKLPCAQDNVEAPPPSTVPAAPRTALSRVYCKAGIILAHPRTKLPRAQCFCLPVVDGQSPNASTFHASNGRAFPCRCRERIPTTLCATAAAPFTCAPAQARACAPVACRRRQLPTAALPHPTRYHPARYPHPPQAAPTAALPHTCPIRSHPYPSAPTAPLPHTRRQGVPPPRP